MINLRGTERDQMYLTRSTMQSRPVFFHVSTRVNNEHPVHEMGRLGDVSDLTATHKYLASVFFHLVFATAPSQKTARSLSKPTFILLSLAI